jgi:hypothetical protein
MDFLDQKFATVNRAKYAEFLGIGKKDRVVKAQNVAEQNLLDRYPFSSDCETQKKLVQDLLAESAKLLVRRNGAKKGKSRDNMSGWLDVYDAYIPAAIEFMNSVSCSVPVTPKVETPVVPDPVKVSNNNPVLNTAIVTDTSNLAADANEGLASIFKAPMSKNVKYALIGLGVVILIVGGIAIFKRN